MRTTAPLRVLVTLCALAALAALPAQAQQVDRIKATGANAVGICGGSLEMIGRSMDQAENRDPALIGEVQRARDFFLDMPRFPAPEISAAAEAFITLMLDRLNKAATVRERQAIQREIVQLSIGCANSANLNVRALQNGANPLPTAPLPAAPAIGGTIQPYQPAPAIVQPYSTQPLLLDPPIVPSQ